MDNLPNWYHKALADKHLMLSLKQCVLAHLEGNPDDTVQEIMSVNDIHPIFESEVEEFITEVRG